MRMAKRSMVEGHAPAMVTGVAGKLRQERVRRCGLPSWNSGQWGMSRVVGVTVVLLRWRRSSEDELSSAMAPAALGAGMAAAAGEEEGRGNEKWSAEGVGRTLVGLRLRPGALWPTRTDRRRRAAVSRATRRAKPEAGRP